MFQLNLNVRKDKYHIPALVCELVLQNNTFFSVLVIGRVEPFSNSPH